jgi:hypothetical protein
MAGGDLILFGQPPRLNTTAAQIGINLMSTYEPYFIAGALTAKATPSGSEFLARRPREARPTWLHPYSEAYYTVRGVSAVGWLFPAENQFVPLVALYDEYNRSAGWGLSLVNNYEGAYKGGRWLFSGVNEPASFYEDSHFISVLVAAVKGVMLGRSAAPIDLPSEPITSFQMPLKREPPPRVANASKNTSSKNTASKNNSFVHLSQDKLHLLAPAGGRYFLLYTHHALYSPCTILTMHYTHHALYSPCTILTMHYTHHTLYSPCTILTIHYTHHTLYSPYRWALLPARG